MYGLKHLFTAAAAHYRKPPLRSTPIRHSSRQSRRAAAAINRKWPKSVPKELSGCVVMLTCESSAAGSVCNVYLVGSDHECRDSWQQVRAAVKYFKPEAVFIELCSSRKYVLGLEKRKVPSMREMVDMWKRNLKPSFILFKWYCDAIYEHDLSHIDEYEGGDMRAAYAEAVKCGAKVILGDRPIDITTQRYWAKTSLLDLLEPICVEFPKYTEDRSNRKSRFHYMDQYGRAVAKKYPIYMEICVHERDLYMSAKLLEVAREYNSVVAVVGEAHLAGMAKNWKQHVDVEQLLSIPIDKKPLTVERIVKSIRAIVVMAGELWGVALRNIKRSRS